jgi:hypothetical protein
MANPIKDAVHDFIAGVPDYIALTWQAMTWGELAGIVVYLLGMRVFAESLLESRAALERLPRYMISLQDDDWGQLVFWPFIVAFLVACHFAIRKEDAKNVEAFVADQMRREPRARHPNFQRYVTPAAAAPTTSPPRSP